MANGSAWDSAKTPRNMKAMPVSYLTSVDDKNKQRSEEKKIGSIRLQSSLPSSLSDLVKMWEAFLCHTAASTIHKSIPGKAFSHRVWRGLSLHGRNMAKNSRKPWERLTKQTSVNHQFPPLLATHWVNKVPDRSKVFRPHAQGFQRLFKNRTHSRRETFRAT